MNRTVICPDCHGAGSRIYGTRWFADMTDDHMANVKAAEDAKCRTCDGSGAVEVEILGPARGAVRR